MRTLRRGALGLTPLLLLTLSASALADTEITPDELAKMRQAEAKKGKRYTIKFLRFHKVFNRQLKVFGGLDKDGTVRQPPLKGQLVVKSNELLDRLQNVPPRDSKKRKLVPKQSNILIYGRSSWNAKTKKAFLQVERVVRLPGFEDYFTRQHKRLKRDSIKAREKLIAEVERVTEPFPKEQKRLAPLLRTLRREIVDLSRAALPELPGGAKAHYDMGVKQKDIPLLSGVWTNTEVPEKLRQKALAALKALDAHFYRGSWLGPEEFYEKVGFVPTNRLRQAVDRERKKGQGKAEFERLLEDYEYVPSSLANLVEAMLEEKKRKSGDSDAPDGLLMQVAQKGSIKRGMTKEMVEIACKSKFGSDKMFPTRVERFRETIKKIPHTWESWVMANGVTVYFVQGRVFKLAEPDE